MPWGRMPSNGDEREMAHLEQRLDALKPLIPQKRRPFFVRVRRNAQGGEDIHAQRHQAILQPERSQLASLPGARIRFAA